MVPETFFFGAAFSLLKNLHVSQVRNGGAQPLQSHAATWVEVRLEESWIQRSLAMGKTWVRGRGGWGRRPRRLAESLIVVGFKIHIFERRYQKQEEWEKLHAAFVRILAHQQQVFELREKITPKKATIINQKGPYHQTLKGHFLKTPNKKSQGKNPRCFSRPWPGDVIFRPAGCHHLRVPVGTYPTSRWPGEPHLTGEIEEVVKRCHLCWRFEGFGHSQCVFCAFENCFFASRWMFLASNLFLIKDSACFERIFIALLDIGHHLSLLMLIDCLTNPPWHTFLTEIAYHQKAFFCKGTPVNFITFFRRIFFVVFTGHLQGSLWNLWN